ncbi:hypothetical protein Lwal_0525 [Legionella waltersii]|uniref:Uncharacterized protein n=2 Tax=Legionella waltersii TaxID=66969 RepID=A0A0W1AMN7_9GAMM|nr:hypothetical protein Lwal_0525 [Legionella waltersii]SNV02651.1 Uncharacterised protein [Legionella waltersii]
MWRVGFNYVRRNMSRNLTKTLSEIPIDLRSATDVYVTGKPSERHYSLIAGYRSAILLGRKRFTGAIQTEIGRTIITIAHEDDRVLTRVIPTEPAAQAMVVCHTQKKQNRGIEVNEFLIISKEQTPKVLSTSNRDLDRHLRKQRNLTRVERQDPDEAIVSTDTVVGEVVIDIAGPYFGGNPTHFLPRTLEEAIYPDATLFTTRSINDYRDIREEIESHGPRISGHKNMLFVKDEDGNYKTVPLESRVFVNSTLHRGMKKGPDGNYHPTTCYTAGSSLVNHSKSSIVQRHDGSTIQTISILTNATADVLGHWVLSGANQLLGVNRENMSGLKKMYSKRGVIETLVVHQGAGRWLNNLSLFATGTPFDMTTITIHRDKEGNPLNIMVHKRTKPWPANESLIELKGPDGKTQFVLYDSLIPTSGFWRCLTVGKLTTPIMSESMIQGSIHEGQLGEITDPELLEDMRSQNEKGRYTFGELLGEHVPISMLLSAAGCNRTDERARVTLVSKTGEFDNDKIIRDFIEQDPRSMEYYFCGRAARVLAENLDKAFEANYTLWDENESVRNLWSIVTSATPMYEDLEQCIKKYATVINEVMQDPVEIERMNEQMKWAKEAYDTTMVYARTLAQ